jgi:hypothetical protein
VTPLVDFGDTGVEVRTRPASLFTRARWDDASDIFPDDAESAAAARLPVRTPIVMERDDSAELPVASPAERLDASQSESLWQSESHRQSESLWQSESRAFAGPPFFTPARRRTDESSEWLHGDTATASASRDRVTTSARASRATAASATAERAGRSAVESPVLLRADGERKGGPEGVAVAELPDSIDPYTAALLRDAGAPTSAGFEFPAASDATNLPQCPLALDPPRCVADVSNAWNSTIVSIGLLRGLIIKGLGDALQARVDR